MRIFAKAIISSFKENIEKHGFKGKKDKFVLEINDETIGWVCLNSIPYRERGALGIDPIIGITNRAVERLTCELEDREYDESMRSTAVSNIGYLMPEDSFKEYFFLKSMDYSDVQASVIKLINDIMQYAVPWMKRLSKREELLKGLEKERISANVVKRYTLAALYLLLGKKGQAVEFGRSQLEKTKNPKPFDASKVFGGIEGVTVITPPSGPFIPSKDEIGRYEKFLDRVIGYEV